MKNCASYILLVLMMSTAGASGNAGDLVPRGTGNSHDKDVIESVSEILRSSKLIARVYYTSDCRSSRDDARLPPPRAVVSARPKGLQGLDAIRALFRDDHNVVVEDGGAGIVRIKIGTVSETVLRTKIPSLSIPRDQQYTAALVLATIEGSAEVQAQMRRLGFRFPVVPFAFMPTPPHEGFPHFPALIKNSTLDEALDLLGTTFGDNILYGICGRSRTIDISSAE